MLMNSLFYFVFNLHVKRYQAQWRQTGRPRVSQKGRQASRHCTYTCTCTCRSTNCTILHTLSLHCTLTVIYVIQQEPRLSITKHKIINNTLKIINIDKNIGKHLLTLIEIMAGDTNWVRKPLEYSWFRPVSTPIKQVSI